MWISSGTRAAARKLCMRVNARKACRKPCTASMGLPGSCSPPPPQHLEQGLRRSCPELRESQHELLELRGAKGAGQGREGWVIDDLSVCRHCAWVAC